MGLWAEFINFWILHELGTGEARDFKFGTQIDLGMSHRDRMDDKLPQKGCGEGPGAKL